MSNVKHGQNLRLRIQKLDSPKNKKDSVLVELKKRKRQEVMEDIDLEKKKGEKDVSEKSHLKSSSASDKTIDCAEMKTIEISNSTLIRVTNNVLNEISFHLCQALAKDDIGNSQYSQSVENDLRERLTALSVNFESAQKSVMEFNISQKRDFLENSFKPNDIKANSKSVGTITNENELMQSDMNSKPFNIAKQMSSRSGKPMTEPPTVLGLKPINQQHNVMNNPIKSATTNPANTIIVQSTSTTSTKNIDYASTIEHKNMQSVLCKSHSNNLEMQSTCDTFPTINKSVALRNKAKILPSIISSTARGNPYFKMAKSKGEISLQSTGVSSSHQYVDLTEENETRLTAIEPNTAVPGPLEVPHVLVPLSFLKYLPPGTVYTLDDKPSFLPGMLKQPVTSSISVMTGMSPQSLSSITRMSELHDHPPPT